MSNRILDVVEKFESINGEGDELGRRTYFVRVFGCSANCPGCDTMYSHGKPPATLEHLDASNLVLELREKKIRHVTITGGEPFEQPNLYEFMKHLIQNGIEVTVESNGIIHPTMVAVPSHIVISPKPWMLNDKNRDSYFYWAVQGATFKFVGRPEDVDRIRKWYKIFRLKRAYIMPWVEGKDKTVKSYVKIYLDLLAEVNKKFDESEDIRVVPQFHKILWGFDARGI
jgi:organic radical activating enzyme